MRVCLIVMLLSAQIVQGQSLGGSGFAEALAHLMDGSRDTLALDHLEDVPAIQFDESGWEFFNAYEQKGVEDGKVPLHRFRPLVKEDVVELRDNLAVVLLHERQGWRVRLATFTLEGDPIQSFLLHDRYGYLYEKNFRAYSFDQPVHFNTDAKAFEFYQLMYGYEPIPSIEQPSQDPVEHQSFHQVAVNARGEMELRFSETTGKRMFHRSQAPPVIHEVEFHELSVLTTSYAGEPESALWSETHLTHGDMDSHDTIAIPLSYGTPWEGRSFFLQPREGHSIVDVAQRHENVLVFPGDGTTCELSDWKRYQSPWKDLNAEGLFFQTQSLEPGEASLFPAYTEAELEQAFASVCGANPTDPGSPEPSLSHFRVVVERIVIRVRFEGPSGSGSKFLILYVASGC